MLFKNIFRKKYQVRYYNDFKNPPFNDVFFCLGKPNSLGDKKYERIKIWSKKDKLLKVLGKPYVLKEDILSLCYFEKQREELIRVLK